MRITINNSPTTHRSTGESLLGNNQNDDDNTSHSGGSSKTNRLDRTGTEGDDFAGSSTRDGEALRDNEPDLSDVNAGSSTGAIDPTSCSRDNSRDANVFSFEARPFPTKFSLNEPTIQTASLDQSTPMQLIANKELPTQPDAHDDRGAH